MSNSKNIQALQQAQKIYLDALSEALVAVNDGTPEGNLLHMMLCNEVKTANDTAAQLAQMNAALSTD
jgi:hypothetical protein